MRRRQWFDWHSWVGVNLSLLMVFVLLTGTLASVSRELDWLFVPQMRANSTVPVSQLRWDAMMADFRRLYPDAQPLHLQAPIASWFAPELIAQGPDGIRFRVFFDAETGAVQGASPWFNWQRFLREAHRHLMLPLNIGLTIVGLLSLPLLVSLLSSLHIYRHWWRGFFRLPALPGDRCAAGNRRIKIRRRFWGDLHRFAGVWSIWFVLVSALTGAWYLAERWGLGVSYPPLPVAQAPVVDAAGEVSIERMIEHSRQVYPALTVVAIRFDSQNAQLLLQGQADAWLVRDRANHVAFSLSDGAQTDVRRGDELNWHLRISEAADPLHFGTFGGNPTRFIWAAFGAVLTLLAVSGVYLYGVRLLAAQKSADFEQSAVSVAFGQMPLVWSAPSVILIAACLLLGLRAFVQAF